jgi:signal transduction histidine kinase
MWTIYRNKSFGKPAVQSVAGQLPRCVSRDRAREARCKSDVNGCEALLAIEVKRTPKLPDFDTTCHICYTRFTSLEIAVCWLHGPAYSGKWLMDTRKRPGVLEGRRGMWLMIILLLATYIAVFSSGINQFSTLEIGVLIIVGLLYSLVSICDESFRDRWGVVWGTVIYFAVQLTLGTVFLYVSRVQGWLILMPLVSQSVIWLPRRWMVAACALIFAIILAVTIMDAPRLMEAYRRMVERIPEGAPWSIALQAGAQYLVVIVFVALLVEMAMREERARGELSEAHRKLREYSVQIEDLATVKERNRLAREIHDGLGHYLTVVNVQIEAARAVLESDRPRALDALHKAQSLAQGGLSEVRRSVAALRASPVEGRPLPEAVAALVEDGRAAGLEVDFVIEGEPRSLPPRTELTLYRAAQEGLTNVRKHADASRVEVLLDYRDDGKMRLVVSDNGVGSDDPSGGFGLLGVRERVYLLSGRVDVRTMPGQGFALEVEAPG